jgi:ribosomal protein S18 acetylase RimI-like enzyme
VNLNTTNHNQCVDFPWLCYNTGHIRQRQVVSTMVVTTAVEGTQQAAGDLRPLDPTRDLGKIAALISEAFAQELDAKGRAALREMRWMSHLTPVLWWLSQADPAFHEAFNGFVWQVPAKSGKAKRIVGNVSLNRAPGSRKVWIISNVVVHSGYRGQGIGRKLTQAAVAEASKLGAREVILQVYADNSPARHLYDSLGFQERAGEVNLRLESVPSVAFLEAPGYQLRAWQPADGGEVYQLALRTTAEARCWIRPLRLRHYRPDWWARVGEKLANLLAGRRIYRMVAVRDGQVLGMMALTVAARRGEHQLEILVHPDHAGQLSAALVSRALHLLGAIPSKSVAITIDASQSAVLQVLHNHGFGDKRTLLTMGKDFEP